MKCMFSLTVALALVSSAAAQMRITEWQYNGSEFIEFTNVGTVSVDLTGWSFDDDSRLAGALSLTPFGLVAAGQSVIVCEASAAAFAADWSLVGVAILGDNTVNLGRNDELNLYDANSTLVDRLSYGDQFNPGTIRTVNVSGSPCHGALGANDVYAWSLAYVGDSRGSIASVGGFLGNPGSYTVVDASLVTYGSGCPGTGNLIPALTARGCPALGGQALLSVANAPAAAPAFLLYGIGRATLPVGACMLNLASVLTAVPITVDASGASSFTIVVPTSITPGTLTTQIVVIDGGAADGFTLSNGLEIDIR